MGTPSSPALASSQYHGVVHYQAGYCFLKSQSAGLALLMYDPAHNSPSTLTSRRHDDKHGAALQEGDSATLSGVIIEQEALGESRPVLHLD